MRRVGSGFLVFVVLLAGAARLNAQQTRPRRTDAGSKDAAIQPAERGLTQDHGMKKYHARALAAAERADKQAHRKRPSHKWLVRDATTARDDIDKTLKAIAATEGRSGSEERQRLEQLKGHEQQAYQHADQLVAAVAEGGVSSRAASATVTAHADAVLQHLREADEVMGIVIEQRSARAATAAGALKRN